MLQHYNTFLDFLELIWKKRPRIFLRAYFYQVAFWPIFKFPQPYGILNLAFRFSIIRPSGFGPMDPPLLKVCLTKKFSNENEKLLNWHHLFLDAYEITG